MAHSEYSSLDTLLKVIDVLETNFDNMSSLYFR